MFDPQAELRARYIAARAHHERTLRRMIDAGMSEWNAWQRHPFDFAPYAYLRCGAKSKRTGRPCPHTSLFRNGRCRWHGGLSTGPRTDAGKRRAALNGKPQG